MYLLDSDVVIWLLRGKKDIIKAIERLLKKDKTAVSTITIAEIYQNIFPQEEKSVAQFFDAQTALDISPEIAKNAGLMWQKFHGKISGLSLADCLIAQTCKFWQATLVTLNTKHFPKDEVETLSPL